MLFSYISPVILCIFKICLIILIYLLKLINQDIWYIKLNIEYYHNSCSLVKWLYCEKITDFNTSICNRDNSKWNYSVIIKLDSVLLHRSQSAVHNSHSLLRKQYALI